MVPVVGGLERGSTVESPYCCFFPQSTAHFVINLIIICIVYFVAGHCDLILGNSLQPYKCSLVGVLTTGDVGIVVVVLKCILIYKNLA